MSFEEIISEVQQKPEIWLASHKFYKNRTVKANVWRELAVKLGIEEEVLKKRWKHLKDQFRKELKKQPILRSGAESDDWQSSWQYFNSRLFVKDEIIPTSTTGNLQLVANETEDTEESENTDLQNIETRETETMPEITPPPSSPVNSSASQISRIRVNVRDDMLEIEKRKLKLMEIRLGDNRKFDKLNNDEDYLFLKSILPSMKKLQELQKLRLRGKVNDWLLEAITENEHNVLQNQGYYSQPHASPSNHAYFTQPGSSGFAQNISNIE